MPQWGVIEQGAHVEMTVMKFNINGKSVTVDGDPSMPFLWAVRDLVGLTGTKYGCGIEICRACTVWVDGSPEKSCDMSASEAVGRTITTIEGLSATPAGAKLQQAFIDLQVPQCGYCQSGMLMAATRLLSGGGVPSDAQIDSAIGNICACGTYPRVKAAIKKAAGAGTPVTTPTTKPTTTTTTTRSTTTTTRATTTTTRPRATTTTTRPKATTTTTKPKTTPTTTKTTTTRGDD